MNYIFEKVEQKWRTYWENKSIFRFNRADKKRPIFSVDTPPPYISATRLHAGHAMSFSQADFVVRYMRMMEYNVFYPMGFDDNGLPTERFVEKQYHIDRSKITKAEFRALCLKETQKQSLAYKRLFNKLGICVDWSLQYSTIDKLCRRIAQQSFLDLYRKGLVVRQKKPIIWCPACQTALAQADLEEKESVSSLNFIVFRADDGSTVKIATTRPELLPGCVALFVNPDDARYQRLSGKNVIVPIFGHVVPVLSDPQVDPDFGTGVLMVCTWGDTEDVRRWQEYALETREIVGKNGKMSTSAQALKDMTISNAQKTILGLLQENNLLIDSQPMTHNVKTHERCGTPIEFILAAQWYIKIVEFQDEWRRRGKELEWYPEFMKTKYDAWISGLKWDWCISRQRYYGVPLPVWYCRNCGKVLLPEDRQLPVDPGKDVNVLTECSECGSPDIAPEKDVMDTWMTSSLTPLINCHWKGPAEKNLMARLYPMTLRVQAFEIIRTWLFYTMVKSHFHTDSLPWQKVMISGWGLDAHGKKISKSHGSATDAEAIIEKHSADALRYWAASADLGSDHRFREDDLRIGKRLVTKLWNAAQFTAGHIQDYHPETLSSVSLESSDTWILHCLNETVRKYHDHFRTFEYSKARKKIDEFFWDCFCSNYIEFTKHRLYSTEAARTDSKKAARTTLYHTLSAVIKLYAPFLPFITEEIYALCFAEKDKSASIHTSLLPQYRPDLSKPEIAACLEKTIEAVNLIRKHRSIKGPSIKTPIDSVTIETEEPGSVDLVLVSNVMNVRKINFGRIDLPTVSSDTTKLLVQQ